jgi:hypothetical protein
MIQSKSEFFVSIPIRFMGRCISELINVAFTPINNGTLSGLGARWWMGWGKPDSDRAMRGSNLSVALQPWRARETLNPDQHLCVIGLSSQLQVPRQVIGEACAQFVDSELFRHFPGGG